MQFCWGRTWQLIALSWTVFGVCSRLSPSPPSPLLALAASLSSRCCPACASISADYPKPSTESRSSSIAALEWGAADTGFFFFFWLPAPCCHTGSGGGCWVAESAGMMLSCCKQEESGELQNLGLEGCGVSQWEARGRNYRKSSMWRRQWIYTHTHSNHRVGSIPTHSGSSWSNQIIHLQGLNYS